MDCVTLHKWIDIYSYWFKNRSLAIHILYLVFAWKYIKLEKFRLLFPSIWELLTHIVGVPKTAEHFSLTIASREFTGLKVGAGRIKVDPACQADVWLITPKAWKNGTFKQILCSPLCSSHLSAPWIQNIYIS